MIGVIKTLCIESNSGLIESLDGELFSFSGESVERIELDVLSVGDRVGFDVREQNGQREAICVGLILMP